VLDNLQEAIPLCLEGLRAEGQPIPEGDAPAKEQPINLTVTVAA